MEIPERSFLYNIEPLGKGSPFIESLSSYIARLSSSHCIYTGTLITKIVIPAIQRRYLINIAEKGGDSFSSQSNCVNGVGELANDIIGVMENLTKRNDLSDTALFKFHYILPKLGLLKKKRAWCPLCLEKMNLRNQVYEPLIWNFSLVKICQEHNIFLVDLCPKCESRLNIISRKSIPGYCSRCLFWLGEDKNIKLNENEHYVKQASFVKEVIRWSLEYKEIPYKKEDLASSINWIVKAVFDNNSTYAANQLGVSKTALHCWARGKSLPTFETLTNLCLSLDLTIEEFFNLNKMPEKSLIYQPLINTSKKLNIKRLDHTRIKKMLKEIIISEKHISISNIAKVIGCARQSVLSYFPKECNQIIENNKRIVKIKKDKRITEKCKEIEVAFFQLIEANEFPSNNKIEKIVGKGVLREKVFKDKLYDLKNSFLE